jgi:Rieske Fe-S protein
MSGPEPDAPTRATPRRVVLKSAAVLGVAVPFLAACGSSDNPGASSSSAPETPDSSSGGQSSSTGGGNGGGGGTGGGGADVIAETSEVPKGGGVILSDPGIVITQPSSGEFKGFSPICTHQGCTVTSVSDGTINCPCHGSQFAIDDGSVVAGPAPSPLPPIKIAVQGSDISLA